MLVEVLGGVERRRRWSRDDKMRIIEETLAPGAVVTEIARRHGIATSLVFTWRRRARLATVASAGPRLVPVELRVRRLFEVLPKTRPADAEIFRGFGEDEDERRQQFLVVGGSVM